MGSFHRLVPLGAIHGRRVDAVVTARRTRTQLDNRAVAFRWRGGSTPAVPVNESYAADLHLFAHDFTRSGRKQLLVTTATALDSVAAALMSSTTKPSTFLVQGNP